MKLLIKELVFLSRYLTFDAWAWRHTRDKSGIVTYDRLALVIRHSTLIPSPYPMLIFCTTQSERQK